MLPNPHDNPAHPSQQSIRIQVSCAIAFDLGPPPFGVVHRPSHVAWTAVPETTIHEHRDFSSGKRQICSSPRPRQRPIHSIAKSEGVDNRPKGELRRGVAPRRSLHATPDFGAGGLRRRPFPLLARHREEAGLRHRRPTGTRPHCDRGRRGRPRQGSPCS